MGWGLFGSLAYFALTNRPRPLTLPLNKLSLSAASTRSSAAASAANRSTTAMTASPSPMSPPPPPELYRSKIIYGTNNEGVGPELLLLNDLAAERRESDSGGATTMLNVLTICGGADNYLSLLAHPSVDSVVCVDQNPIQLVVAKLKLAIACSDLSTAEALTFLGMNDDDDVDDRDGSCSSPSAAEDRRRVYETIIEPRLEKSDVSIVRENLLREIGSGFALFGVDRHGFGLWRKCCADNGFDADALWRGTIDRDEWEEFCRNGLGCTAQDLYDAMGLAAVFPPESASVYRDKWEGDVFPRACAGMCRAVLAAADENRGFEVAYALRGRYDEGCMPGWLRPDVRATIQERRDRVKFVNSSLHDLPPSPYDLISTSNIFDWMTTEMAAEVLSTVAEKFLSPDGYLMFRLAFGNTDDVLPLVPKLQASEKVSSQRLARADESIIFYLNTEGTAALRHRRES